tara:strand:+ start:20116 stop:21513 length:1398 start_codon:yes stop_codon:yes gene_type:complete
MQKTKYKKYRTFYLPTAIVDNLLLKIHLGLTDFEFNIEVGLTILNDIITKSAIYNKDEEYDYHFAPLDSRFLKVKYGNSYSDYIRFLVNQGVVWNDYYYKGKTTYYYLYHIDYYIQNSNTLRILHNINKEETLPSPYCFHEGIEITALTTINNKEISNQKNRIYNDWYKVKILINSKNKRYLTNGYEQDSVFINNAPQHIKKMGSHFRKTFKLHHEAAVTFIVEQYKFNLGIATTDDERNKATQKYTSRLSSVLAIENGKNNKTLKFNRNTVNNRIDTNLTFMASELRQFIVGYGDMAHLDLKNSQPVLFNILLKEYYRDADESLKHEINDYFKHTTQGTWYERLQELYNNTREDSKKLWMCLAYSQNGTFKKDKKIFKKVYPGINRIIESYKVKNHADFSNKLTKIESSIFIDGICRELVIRGIIPFTIHDSVIVHKKDKERTLEIMQKVLKMHLGVAPIICYE